MFKTFITLLLCLLNCRQLTTASEEENVVKMYKISCEKINYAYFARNITCRLKAINRHKAVGNINLRLLQPLRNFTVHLQLFKYYSQFRPFLINITLNYCDLMAGQVNKNFYIKMFLRNIINTTNMMRECPFTGELYAREMWMDASYMSLLIPLGRYRVLTAYNEGYPQQYLGEISYYADVYYKGRPGARNKTTAVDKRKKMKMIKELQMSESLEEK